MSVSEFRPSLARTANSGARHFSRRRRLFVGVSLVLLAALAWFGWGFLYPPKPHIASLPSVTTARAEKKNVTVIENTIATVVSPATVHVTAQVQGRLLKAYFQEGQLVHKGDPLFLIDPEPFQNALAKAKAQLAKDEANAESARNNQKRYTTLYAQNAISEQARDNAVATAKADAANVAADKAAVNIAEENLSYTRIDSPIDGKTGPIQIQPGNLITVAGSKPLVTITQIQPIKLSFFLPQNQLTQIQNQMAAGKLYAIVPMAGAPGGQEKAKVDFISNAVNADTGTIELRATFANKDRQLVPGQSLNVGVTLNQIPGATVVPRQAVDLGPESSYVYVVGKDDVIVSKPVTVLNDDGRVDAIKGDVRPGDQVVVQGQLRITPGAKVKVRAAPAASESGPSGGMPL